jgi:phage terminase large subunit-like protein
VKLVAGDWNRALLDEAEAWPASKYKDQIDACSGAFNRLAQGYGYDTTYRAFQSYW